jgi:hypothetical protein
MHSTLSILAMATRRHSPYILRLRRFPVTKLIAFRIRRRLLVRPLAVRDRMGRLRNCRAIRCRTQRRHRDNILTRLGTGRRLVVVVCHIRRRQRRRRHYLHHSRHNYHHTLIHTRSILPTRRIRLLPRSCRLASGHCRLQARLATLYRPAMGLPK